MSRILVIEDDAKLGSQIRGQLLAAGYDVAWWTEGRPVDRDEVSQFSLIVLDLMLPGSYGLDILKALRAHSELPVLVLSACLDSHDKVRALKLGADDYVTKPFWPEELLERVRARLRRPTMQGDGLISLERVTIELAARRVCADSREIELTRFEFELLLLLARRPGAAISRARMVEHLRGHDGEPHSRALDVHVSRLRKKLGDAVKIEAVWGIGYRLAAGR